jgi:hypothetical protein
VSAAHGGDRCARNAGEADADVCPPRDPRRRLGAEVPARAAAPEPRRSDARRVARGMGIGCLRIRAQSLDLCGVSAGDGPFDLRRG